MMTFTRREGGPGEDLRSLLFTAERGGPPTTAGIRGVVVDVAVEAGVDTVAGFADGSARYLNHADATIVWEAQDATIGARVAALLAATEPVLAVAGPFDGAVPPPPSEGQAQVAVLAPAGVLVGRGPYDALTADAVAGPVIGAAFELMVTLMQGTAAGQPAAPHEGREGREGGEGGERPAGG
jgi:hypothetical protein